MINLTSPSLNVLGTFLESCSTDPLTGYSRNGCCESDLKDKHRHFICAVMTQAFLDFSNLEGNDLARPNSKNNFPGLVAGDQWCLCVDRWIAAFTAKVAPPIILTSTHEQVLLFVTLAQLEENNVQYY